MTVYAAGVICWREAGEDIEVLLVHREQYDDWAFPKGKQDKANSCKRPQCEKSKRKQA